MGIISDHKDFLKPVALLLGVLVLLGIVMSTGGVDSNLLNWGNNNNGDNQPTATPTPTSTPAEAKYPEKPNMQIDTSKDYYAIVSTSEGNIKIDLFERGTPETVNSFVFLAQNGYYNNLTFHRIIKNFIIQGGHPEDKDIGYTLPDEIDATEIGIHNTQIKDLSFDLEEDLANKEQTLQEYYESKGFSYSEEYRTERMKAGVAAMSKSEEVPDVSKGQFFILLSGIRYENARSLDGKYTTFGVVTDGMDVVDRIGNSDADSITIYTVEIFSQ